MDNFFSPLFLLLIAFSYLLGSVPVGYLVANRLTKRDLSEHKHHDYNLDRFLSVFGTRLTVLTFVLSATKGVIAVYAMKSFDFDVSAQALAGLAAMVGHCFPVWFNFIGGKGLSVGFGVLCALSLALGLCVGLVFILSFVVTRIISLSGLVASIAAFMSSVIYVHNNNESLVILLGVVLIVTRHYQNIAKIIAGTEQRWPK